MAVVEIDPQEFREAYAPRFDEMSDARIEAAFAQACLLLDNTEKSRIPYDPENGVTVRKTLIELLMCHILSLSQLPTGAAGPMTSATEGSVSVGYATLTVNSGKWYAQTPCGQAFWQAVLPWLAGGRYYARRDPHPWG